MLFRSGSSNPFDGCTNLARFVVAEGNENFKTVDGVIYGKTEKWIVAVPSARQGDFTIGENIVGIGSYAFGGSQLSKIILAKETKIFAEGAFARSQISDFSFRSDYLAEEYYYDRKLFEGCSKLQKFVFPENMIYNVSIDLSGCTSLKEIILPKGLIETNEFAQGCSKLEKVQLPETLLELPDNCFSDCTMLSQINLDKIEKIGSNTFLNCKGLKGELNLESTNTIRARAFAGCTGITSVTLSDNHSSRSAFVRSDTDVG